jgi:hypothetical protein
MARLTLLTNRLNPIQEKNLKLYPLIFFNGITEAKMDFDLSNDQMIETLESVDKKKDDKDETYSELNIKYEFGKAETRHLRVSYHLTIDETADNSHLEKRFKATEKSVHNLLFKDIRVQVFINGKLAYESKNV